MIVVLKLYTFESTAHTKVFVYQRKVMNNLSPVTNLWIHQGTNSQRHGWTLSIEKRICKTTFHYDSITWRKCFSGIPVSTWGAKDCELRKMVELLNMALGRQA